MLESDGQDFKDFLSMDYDHILAQVPRTIFHVLLVEICLRMTPTSLESSHALIAHTEGITAILEAIRKAKIFPACGRPSEFGLNKATS